MLEVLKRDGTVVPFDKEKIVNAILKAFKAVDGEISEYARKKAENIADYIEQYDYIGQANITQDMSESDALDVIHKSTCAPVETIQDLVEHGLMATKRKDVARAYISYRDQRTRERDKKSAMRKIIREKVSAKNIKNQNANVDEASFGGRMGESNSAVMRQLALDEYLSEKTRINHETNRIYQHDLDHWVVGDHNCLSVPLDDLLSNGFNTRQTDVRPANSINTAFQLVAVLFQLQSLQQFGGVSATHLDWTLVPYVRKSFMKHYIISYLKTTDEFYSLDIDQMSNDELDDWVTTHKQKYLNELNLTEEDFYFDNAGKLNNALYRCALFDTRRETYQAAEGLYHNLNTLQSRSGNQLPFTSINYGTCTLPEGRLACHALLDALLKGVGKLHRTSVFPCGIFQYMKGVNDKPNTPNYDLKRKALKCTAKRLYPNYANVDWSGNAGYDINDPRTYFSTMGCRTANGWDINGFGQLKDGRGNICPATIILPTLAMEAKTDIMNRHIENNDTDVVDRFMEILDIAIHDAKDSLIERFEWICSQDAASAKFMYENGLMAGYIPEEGIRSALKHGTLAVGQLGLAEALQILIGTDHTTDDGLTLAKRIEHLFQTRCAEFKESYRLNFGVYYTPAENLSHTALKKFREKYGVIENVSDKEFFTNSMHVPVWKEMSPFDKIDIESQLTGYSSAGCITYVELDGDVANNIDALEQLVDYAMDHDIPYFAVNVPNDTCLDCGVTGEFNDKCPTCGSENIQQLRRVTGYLTGNYKTAFNTGKQDEVERRVKHR